jgi:hypothetical protein
VKLAFALVLVATVAPAQDHDPCNEGYCKERTFHVTSVEAKDISDSGEACYPGYCTATRYDVSGFVKSTGKNAIVYRAYCNDIVWLTGESKGRHDACDQVEAGESYRARIFPQVIDFSFGKHTWVYQIASQREASGKRSGANMVDPITGWSLVRTVAGRYKEALRSGKGP